jgi:hypothetical protein
MIEQLTQLVKQFGGEAVVNNSAVPNEHNEAVLNNASDSILDSLKNIATQGGGAELLGSLFKGDAAIDASNPVVQKISEQLTSSLGSKFGLSSDAASGVAESLIPNVLGSLVGTAKDPANPGFQISDVVGALTNGDSAVSGEIMSAISKYGVQFGLDQDGDGQVGISDAVAAVSGKSGGFLNGLLGKFLGK